MEKLWQIESRRPQCLFCLSSTPPPKQRTGLSRNYTKQGIADGLLVVEKNLVTLDEYLSWVSLRVIKEFSRCFVHLQNLSEAGRLEESKYYSYLQKREERWPKKLQGNQSDIYPRVDTRVDFKGGNQQTTRGQLSVSGSQHRFAPLQVLPDISF